LRKLGSNTGASAPGAAASTPLSPSTITLRTSVKLAPTSAIRAAPSARATSRTHSAPARVLPKPRPAQISQVRHASCGGSCASRAQPSQ
jgi:hypothetical protein